jgi:hypothetical protein
LNSRSAPIPRPIRRRAFLAVQQSCTPLASSHSGRHRLGPRRLWSSIRVGAMHRPKHNPRPVPVQGVRA